MTFGERVQKARLQLFMSQESIAKELGVSFATVNRWENGRTKPSLSAQKAFYDFCKKYNLEFKGENE